MTQEEILQKSRILGERAQSAHVLETDNNADVLAKDKLLTDILDEFHEFVRTIPDHFLQIAAGREFAKARFE